MDIRKISNDLSAGGKSHQLTDEHINQFSDAVEKHPKPIFAFCRTGTRAATLWSLSEGVKGRPFQQILKATNAAGYDLSELESWIVSSNAFCRQVTNCQT